MSFLSQLIGSAQQLVREKQGSNLLGSTELKNLCSPWHFDILLKGLEAIKTVW